MVISHGFTDAGRFDDTWAFDFRNNSWANISPNSNRPLRRCLHHAAYDSANSRMYLYGGCSSPFGPCPQGDLWVFDLNRNEWTELKLIGIPPAREHYGMAFDATRDRLVVFGGAGPGLLNDTWEYDSQWLDGNRHPSSVRYRRVGSATRRPIFPIAGCCCSLVGPLRLD